MLPQVEEQCQIKLPTVYIESFCIQIAMIFVQLPIERCTASSRYQSLGSFHQNKMLDKKPSLAERDTQRPLGHFLASLCASAPHETPDILNCRSSRPP